MTRTILLISCIGLMIIELSLIVVGVIEGTRREKGDMERNYFNGYVDGKASCSQPSL